MNRTKLRSMSPEQRDELRMKYTRILSYLYSELRSYAGDDATIESDAAVRKLQRMSKKYRRLCQEMELIELSNAGSYCDMTKGKSSTSSVSSLRNLSIYSAEMNGLKT